MGATTARSLDAADRSHGRCAVSIDVRAGSGGSVGIAERPTASGSGTCSWIRTDSSRGGGAAGAEAVFVEATATALPPEPIDLTGGNVPPGASPIQLVGTRPFRVTLPRQLSAGPYRFCLQAYGAGSTAADSDTCAPMVVRDPASTVTSVPSIASAPSKIGSPPTGIEEPLVEVAITGVQSVAKPYSVNALSVQGHPDVLVWTTLMLNPQTGHVEEWPCVSEAGGSGCGAISIPAQFGQTSSIDNQVASDDLFTWINLPPDVAIVTYDDGVKQLWQRPMLGTAIFRVDPDHPHPTISAYDADLELVRRERPIHRCGSGGCAAPGSVITGLFSTAPYEAGRRVGWTRSSRRSMS